MNRFFFFTHKNGRIAYLCMIKLNHPRLLFLQIIGNMPQPDMWKENVLKKRERL